MPFSREQKEFITRKLYGLHWLSAANGVKAVRLFREYWGEPISHQTIYTYWKANGLQPGPLGGHRHGATDDDLRRLYRSHDGNLERIMETTGIKHMKTLRKRCYKLGLIKPKEPFTLLQKAYVTETLHEKSGANGVVAASLFKEHFKRYISPGTIYKYWKNAGLKPGKQDLYSRMMAYEELFTTSIRKITSTR